MANTCFVRFYIFGNRKEIIDDLLCKINRASDIAMAKSTPSEWGDFYKEFQDVLNVSCVNKDEDFIRNVVANMNEETFEEGRNNFILVEAEAKWSPNASHMVRLIKKAYPAGEVRCFYEAEELGSGIYESNDIRHEFIKSEYIFDGYMEGGSCVEYMTKKQLIDYLNHARSLNLKYSASEKEINDCLEDGEIAIKMSFNYKCPA